MSNIRYSTLNTLTTDYTDFTTSYIHGRGFSFTLYSYAGLSVDKTSSFRVIFRCFTPKLLSRVGLGNPVTHGAAYLYIMYTIRARAPTHLVLEETTNCGYIDFRDDLFSITYYQLPTTWLCFQLFKVKLQNHVETKIYSRKSKCSNGSMLWYCI